MKENPVDLLYEAASILDFLCEALSALANQSNDLSTQGVEGLACLCIHLRGLCQEAAQDD